jgi:prolyl-tRNA synthetase
LTSNGHSVLYDDRADASAGEKLHDADLIGIPQRLIVSDKTLAENSYELKDRRQETSRMIGLDEIKDSLANSLNA